MYWCVSVCVCIYMNHNPYTVDISFQIHPKHDDTSRHDKLTPPPQPPVRRKKKHRIVTQDIPSNLSLPYTIDSDLTDSSTGSLDNLVQANMTYCTESNDSNTGVQTGMDTTQKQPQGSTPPTAKKPQILRPKPKINAHRPKISSFTMEDMDICQGELWFRLLERAIWMMNGIIVIGSQVIVANNHWVSNWGTF